MPALEDPGSVTLSASVCAHETVREREINKISFGFSVTFGSFLWFLWSFDQPASSIAAIAAIPYIPEIRLRSQYTKLYSLNCILATKTLFYFIFVCNNFMSVKVVASHLCQNKFDGKPDFVRDWVTVSTTETAIEGFQPQRH